MKDARQKKKKPIRSLVVGNKYLLLTGLTVDGIYEYNEITKFNGMKQGA